MKGGGFFGSSGSDCKPQLHELRYNLLEDAFPNYLAAVKLAFRLKDASEVMALIKLAGSTYAQLLAGEQKLGKSGNPTSYNHAFHTVLKRDYPQLYEAITEIGERPDLIKNFLTVDFSGGGGGLELQGNNSSQVSRGKQITTTTQSSQGQHATSQSDQATKVHTMSSQVEKQVHEHASALLAKLGMDSSSDGTHTGGATTRKRGTKVHVGPRGGKYVIKGGAKHYV